MQKRLLKYGFTLLIVLSLGAIFYKNRYLNHHDFDTSKYNIAHALKTENVVPVVIVGSGPAGLSAGLYCARAGIKSFVFAGPMPCGQLTQTTYIENWPGRNKVLGLDLMQDIKGQAISFGAEVIHDTVTNIDFSVWPYVIKTDENVELKALSVIVATGATPKRLHVPGEEKYWGKGVTTCAICDAFFFKDKDVVICGGGDSAVEMVFELAPYAKTIKVLVRKGSMKAAASMQKKLAGIAQVSVQYHKEIHEIYGDDGKVTGIKVFDNQTQEIADVPIDGVFLAIGHDPNNSLIKDSAIAMDKFGYIKTIDRSQKTSLTGVFAAGEIQDAYYRQAVIASSEGVKAALDTAGFLYEIGLNPEAAAQLESNFFVQVSEDTLEIKELTEIQEFKDEVLNSKGIIAVEMFFPECPSCMQMVPIFEAAAAKLEGKVKVVKLNRAKIRKTILPFIWYEPYNIKVRKYPAFLIFKDGQLVEINNNVYSKRELVQYLEKFL